MSMTDESDEATDADTDDEDDADGDIGLAEARDASLAAAEDLLDDPIDGVIRIERVDDGWRTLIEVVERSAIPDTQDILGRYEIVVDGQGTVQAYGLEERYRRGESRDEL